MGLESSALEYCSQRQVNRLSSPISRPPPISQRSDECDQSKSVDSSSANSSGLVRFLTARDSML